VTRDQAKAYVARLHRHNKPPLSHKFSVGVAKFAGFAEEDGKPLYFVPGIDAITKDIVLGLRGVAICGRPVARALDDGMTLEVTRVCTDGEPNACSFLYDAARRAAAAMGYTLIYTYTQADEGGASLRAAGFRKDAELAARGSWADHSKARGDRQQSNGGVPRVRWVWP
jgi:hypothetical protein